MTDSLKQKLKDIVLSKGYLSYGELVEICETQKFKISNGERRMRELCDGGMIFPVKAKNYIKGWTLRGGVIDRINSIPAMKPVPAPRQEKML